MMSIFNNNLNNAYAIINKPLLVTTETLVYIFFNNFKL